MTKKEQPAAGHSALPGPAPAQVPPGQGPAPAQVPPGQGGDAPIATPEEVLAILTNLLRSDKAAEQLRAAEHLAKHYGILTPREEAQAGKSAIAGEIEAAIRSLEEERHGQGSP